MSKQNQVQTGANRYEIDQVLRQLGDLHREAAGFRDRQEQELDALNRGLENQNEMLKNHGQLLEGQSSILNEIHGGGRHP